MLTCGPLGCLLFSFHDSSSSVNGNGYTAFDVFQRLHAHIKDLILEHGDADAWAATSSQLAKVAAESWSKDAKQSEAADDDATQKPSPHTNDDGAPGTSGTAAPASQASTRSEVGAKCTHDPPLVYAYVVLALWQ